MRRIVSLVKRFVTWLGQPAWDYTPGGRPPRDVGSLSNRDIDDSL